MNTLDSMLALLVEDDPRRSADRILTRLVQIHQARGGAILRPRQDQAEIWLSAGLASPPTLTVQAFERLSPHYGLVVVSHSIPGSDFRLMAGMLEKCAKKNSGGMSAYAIAFISKKQA